MTQRTAEQTKRDYYRSLVQVADLTPQAANVVIEAIDAIASARAREMVRDLRAEVVPEADRG